MNTPVYMDYHATTPVDPRVLEAMLPYFTQHFGNAASRNHQYGWDAEGAVAKARRQVAELIHAQPAEIIFTSGATESDNLAIKGVARALRPRGHHLITLPTEHKAVLDTCHRLEAEGFSVTYLPLDKDGLMNLAELDKAFTPQTILVTIMAAHNEIGVLQPVEQIGRLCRARGVLFHTDAVQAVGKIPIDVQAMSIDLLSLSAHKIYGPKGVGALYVRKGVPPLQPLIDGGGHEQGLRSGTLNVPGIVGLGKACEVCGAEMAAEAPRLALLRDRLKAVILGSLPQVTVNGSMQHRLPHNLNLNFPGLQTEMLLMSLPDVAISASSACTSAKQEPSHVIESLGAGSDAAHATLRFGLGRFTTPEEVEFVARRVVEAVNSLMDISTPATAAQN
jgi:cysteine desulfurase